MNLANLVPSALQAIQSVLPVLSTLVGASKESAVGKVIDFITEAAPVVRDQYEDLKPIVTNIINVVRSDDSTTIEQLDALEAAEKILDKDFDDAAAAALAEDAKNTGAS